jgi:hypothetical protein
MPITIIDPALRAGWEPGTPETDSLLRRFLVNWTDSIEHHGVPLGARTLRRDDLAAVDVGRPMDLANVATLLAPLFLDGVEEIAGALDDFYGFSSGTGSGTVYLFSPWPTPDLRSQGWSLEGYLPLMLRPPGGHLPAAPHGLRIEEVRSESGLRGFESAIVRGFSLSELEALGPGSAFTGADLHDDRVRMWVGWEDGRPVSAASTFIEAEINQVALVGTVPEARRRGYGAAVAWRATLADPSLPSMLLATDEGHKVYEQMGYWTLFRFPLWSRVRPGERPAAAGT